MIGMALTSCVFRSRCSAEETVAKKILLINKNLIHLIDDIFWKMESKTEIQDEKVVLIVCLLHQLNQLQHFYSQNVFHCTVIYLKN
jgi:hypothetical protein